MTGPLVKLVTFWILSSIEALYISVKASHTVGDPYTGSGIISIETEGALEDQEGNSIRCTLQGTPYVEIQWKWRNTRTFNPEHYFLWTTSKITIAGVRISTSQLFFKSGISESDKRDAGGVIYGEGVHPDNPSIKTTCSDIKLIITSSHTVANPYTGSGVIPLETAGGLKDQEGNVIQCTLQGAPYLEIQWKWRNTKTVKPEHYFSWSTSQIIIAGVSISTSQLSFKSGISELDKKDASGVIYAEGVHPDDPSTKTACIDINLIITWKPKETPALIVTKTPHVIGDDNIAQLTCHLVEKGNPEGQVRWIRNGNLQSESAYNTQTISIPLTRDIDGDKWQCYYYNTAGDGNYSDDIMINAHWSPGDATISADTQTPKRGDTFTFKCTGDRGNPPGQVWWYLSGTMVTNTTNKQYAVTDAKESYNGNWSCIFSNYLSKGAQSQTIQIQVQYKPSKPELVLDVNSNNIRFGDNFTIQCVSQHGTNTIWLKNNDVQDGPSFTNNTIAIIHADASVIGVWSCYVSNEVGKSIVSNAVEISVKYLPGVDIDYITYEFTSESISFTLKITDLFVASNLEVSVCSVGDYPSCTMEQQLDNKHSSTIEQRVVLPVSSDDAVYNVTFTFSDDYRIVTRHGMAIKGPVVQSQIPTILAVLLGTLLVVAVVTIIALVYVLHWRNKSKGIPVPRENSVQYVNVGPDGNAGDITHIQAAPEYEDVNTAATTNGQSSNIASHSVQDQYSGSGLIPVENEGVLSDQEGTPLQ